MRRLDTDEKVEYRWEGWIQLRRLNTVEKVEYRWEGWIQMKRFDTDEKVECRWEGWIQRRRFDTDEWEGWIQMRRLDTDEKVAYRWEGWIQMRRFDTDGREGWIQTDEKVEYRDWKGQIKVYSHSQCPKVKTWYRYKTRNRKQGFMHVIFVYIHICKNKPFFLKVPLFTFIFFYQN